MPVYYDNVRQRQYEAGKADRIPPRCYGPKLATLGPALPTTAIAYEHKLARESNEIELVTNKVPCLIGIRSAHASMPRHLRGVCTRYRWALIGRPNPYCCLSYIIVIFIRMASRQSSNPTLYSIARFNCDNPMRFARSDPKMRTAPDTPV